MVTTRIDAGVFLRAKLEALAAYRSQFPFEPDTLPESIFEDLFGTEYFTQVLPLHHIENELTVLSRQRVSVAPSEVRV